jgi:DnaJ-class molecular chaperone
MSPRAFQPEHIVDQIHAFFKGVHDISDFYYKLYLLRDLCRACDGRGYVLTPEQSCSHCHGSGSRDPQRKAVLTAG